MIITTTITIAIIFSRQSLIYCSQTPFLSFSCSTLWNRDLTVFKGHMSAGVFAGFSCGKHPQETGMQEEGRCRVLLFPFFCIGCCFSIILFTPDESPQFWLLLGASNSGQWKQKHKLSIGFRGRDFLCCLFLSYFTVRLGQSSLSSPVQQKPSLSKYPLF